MNNIKFFAGIDGGGSKTLAVIVDENGNEVGRGLAGSSNNQVVGAVAAARAIGEAVGNATKAAGVTLPLAKIIVGLAGVDRPADHSLMLTTIEKLELAAPSDILLDNDARLIVYALTDGVGVGLVAGTGSIALGRNGQGQTARAGGWGYVFGDEGSGYQLGRAALQAAARAADQRGPATLLLPLIMHEWQLSDPSEMIGVVYHSGTPNNQQIAGLARLVFDAAASDDIVAQSLVEQAAQELALAVVTVAAELELGQHEPLPLALAGGLLVNFATLRERVLQQLKASGLSLGQVISVAEPAVAAAQTASRL